MKTLYWVWLHFLLIALLAVLINAFVLNLYFPNYATVTSHLTSKLASVAFLSFIVAMVFTAYIQPYRWFWCMWLVWLFAVPMLYTFAGYVIPWGQLSFYIASILGQSNLLNIIDSFSNGFPLPIQLFQFVLLCILPILLVIQKIRQINLAGISRGQEHQLSELYIGRYTFIGIVGLFLLTILYIIDGYYTFLGVKKLVSIVPEKTFDFDALGTPKHIVPEWYFLPALSILRSVPDKILGVMAFLGMLLIPLILPWLDKGPLKPLWLRVYYIPFFVVFLISVLALFYFGAKPFEGETILWTRVAMAYYFSHFLIVIPIISRLKF